MKVQPLGPNPLGATHCAVFTYLDVAALGAATDGAALAALPGTTAGAFPAVGTSGTDTIPIGHLVQVVGMKLKTHFDCSGTGNLTISIGYGGAETSLLAATQIALDSTEVHYAAGSGTIYAIESAADTIDAFFDSSAVNLNTYTSGEVWIFLKVVNLEDIQPDDPSA